VFYSGCSRDLNAVTGDLLRGVVAAMAMTGMRSLTKELGIVRLTPPEELVRHGAGAALLQRVAPAHRRTVLELAHWAYGGLGAAAFSLAPPRAHRSKTAGAAYGLALWALFEAMIAPVAGADRARPVAERVAIAGDHLLYGLVLTSGR
jgi:hypothetical protein